jgi:energy-coupling factor transporter ATP-binding protein EcfA2
MKPSASPRPRGESMTRIHVKLINARVLGFQSFSDSGEIEFTDGINLLVGQNNAGKSSLLRALQPSLPDDRHRTPDRWENFRLAPPEVRLTVEISGSDLRDEILRTGQSFIPVPKGQDANVYAQGILNTAHIRVGVVHRPGSRFSTSYPGHGQFSGVPELCGTSSSRDGEIEFSGRHGGDDSTGSLVHNMWEREMFYFSAERMNIGESAPAHVQRLTSNAQNLPAVLLTLSGDRGDLFAKLVQHLREIFSTVGNLSVRPNPSGTIEIRVWPTESMERVDLSFPLLQSGTGVSQIISILTAVITVDNAVVIIDEINSFLHPAAVKSLLRILQTEYSNHQYIISTHSPEVISFSNAKTLHLVKRSGYESMITPMNLGEIFAFREIAEQLGVSMADIFAADCIIWVEGPTEELCFPWLYQQVVGAPLPRGTSFTSVLATGDFIAKRRDKELVYKIYSRLSQAAAPLVKSVAFSFDSENLSDLEKLSMVRDSRGKMHFLPRRHIECFLINSAAIAAFITDRDAHLRGVLTIEMVREKLTTLAGSKQFSVPEWAGNIDDAAWQARVDAANLIDQTCEVLSESRARFNKNDDTLELLQRVWRENPGQISDLSEYTRALVASVG